MEINVSSRVTHTVLAFLLCWAQGVFAQSATPPISVDGLSPEANRIFGDSVATFLRAKAGADRSANNLGWDCQAAAELASLGVPGAKPRLLAIADELAADVVRSEKTGKAVGWAWDTTEDKVKACVPAKGPDSNVDARCEAGVRTIYAFQSGLGMACMAQAGRLLPNGSKYLTVAQEVMDYWKRLQMKKAPCPNCIYFATSDSVTDEVRYIRNMNLFIAFGASQLAAATTDKDLSELARRSIQSDVWERESGNRGYLGKLDPIWSSRPRENERIENHAASMAMLLNVMGKSLEDDKTSRLGFTVWQDWATCDNSRCLSAGCKYWAGDANKCQSTATAAHCAFRLQSPQAKSQCELLFDKTKRLGGYGIWSVLQARPR